MQRVSADADADGGEGTPDPGPEEIVIDTIDRSKPVMDDILHSAADNAPAGLFSYPHFNEVDRPELLAHDLACLLYTSLRKCRTVKVWCFRAAAEIFGNGKMASIKCWQKKKYCKMGRTLKKYTHLSLSLIHI